MPLQLDDYRLLGRSGLRVSPLALGTMTFGVGEGSWGSSEDEARAMVDIYIERGGNFIDTADFYGQMGGSEEWLGKLVKGRRNSQVISTKYSLTTQPGNPNAAGNHRKNMVLSVEDSLRRMQTDYIDLLYLHMWDFRTPVDEILRAFDDLVRAGKVLYIGLSDTPAWQASRMQAIAELRGWTQFCALQICYSLIERTVERELIPMAKEMGMGVSPWAPLGQGVLTGKYKPGAAPPAGSRATNGQMNQFIGGMLKPRLLEAVEQLKPLAADAGLSLPQFALAWVLRESNIASAIIGASRPEQVIDNAGASGANVPPELFVKAQEIVAAGMSVG